LHQQQNHYWSLCFRGLAGKIDEDLDEIKDAVSNYQNKLKDAVTRIEGTK
jgi:hypothetical protein